MVLLETVGKIIKIQEIKFSKRYLKFCVTLDNVLTINFLERVEKFTMLKYKLTDGLIPYSFASK